MATYGTTQRQIAAVCAKNHQHSVHNPCSRFRKPHTIEEVLAAPPITCARHAIQENGGGPQGVEEAAVAIHILSK